MADVFISYSSQDRPRVAPIVDALQNRGVNVFWDQHIKPGEAWEQELKRHLDNSKAAIVVWSPKSVESEWVRAEAVQAIQERKLVPITIGSAVEPPLGLKLDESIPLDQPPASDPDFERLIDELRRRGIPVREPTVVAPAAAPIGDSYNRGFAFISHTHDDLPALSVVREFLRGREYSYWSYHESERDYQKPTVLEIEERMNDSALVITVVTPEWKRSDWTQRELAFAREIRKPLFHLRFKNPGPTLAIAGDTYFDVEADGNDALRRFGVELDKKKL